MSAAIRALLIISSLFTVAYILRKIHKSQMRIQDSVFWVVFSFVILFMAIFPGIVISIAGLLGIASPVNLVFLVFIFFAYIKIFAMTIRIAVLESKIRSLSYEIALQEKKGEKVDRSDTGK